LALVWQKLKLFWMQDAFGLFDLSELLRSVNVKRSSEKKNERMIFRTPTIVISFALDTFGTCHAERCQINLAAYAGLTKNWVT